MRIYILYVNMCIYIILNISIYIIYIWILEPTAIQNPAALTSSASVLMSLTSNGGCTGQMPP